MRRQTPVVQDVWLVTCWPMLPETGLAYPTWSKKPRACARNQGGKPHHHNLGKVTHPLIHELGLIQSAFPQSCQPHQLVLSEKEWGEHGNFCSSSCPRDRKWCWNFLPLRVKEGKSRTVPGRRDAATEVLFMELWSVDPVEAAFLDIRFKNGNLEFSASILLPSKPEGINVALPCLGVRNVTFLFL